jgi:hypothetical protein
MSQICVQRERKKDYLSNKAGPRLLVLLEISQVGKVFSDPKCQQTGFQNDSDNDRPDGACQKNSDTTENSLDDWAVEEGMNNSSAGQYRQSDQHNGENEPDQAGGGKSLKLQIEEPLGNNPLTLLACFQLVQPSFQMRSAGDNSPFVANSFNSSVEIGPSFWSP